mgnify:CR=1 FL=1
MNCKECPYIKDEFNERMLYCDEYFPGHYSEDDITECCYCVKTDGRLCWTGTCDKFPSEKIRRVCNKNPKKRRSTKRERDKKYKERMKYLYDTLGHLVSSPVDKYEYYTENLDGVAYYKRCWFAGTKYHKRQSNKAVRRSKDIPVRGRGYYKKIYDVEWEIY